MAPQRGILSLKVFSHHAQRQTGVAFATTTTIVLKRFYGTARMLKMKEIILKAVMMMMTVAMPQRGVFYVKSFPHHIKR